MPIARLEHFGELLEPGLRKIFYEVYNHYPSLIPDLFNMQSTGNPYEEDLSVGTMGDFPEFHGVVEYDRPYQGYTSLYEFPEYAKGFRIERRLYDDDRYNIINKRPAGLAISAQRLREEQAASVFDNAFNAAFPGPDDVALCSAAHPSTAPDGPATRQNADTLALNHENLEITARRMRQTQDDRGGLISVVPDTLVVHLDNHETAWELIKSEKVVDTADNNPNIHQGRYRLISWPYLQSADAWFLIDSNYSKMFLNWFDRIPIEFAMEEDFDSLVAKFRAYARWGYGWSDWVWIYGNNP